MSRDEKLPIGSQVFYMAHNLTFDIGWQKFAAELAYDYGQDEVRPGEIYDVAHLRNLRLKIYRRKDAGFRYGFLTPKDGRVKSAITVNCSASSTANPLGGKSL